MRQCNKTVRSRVLSTRSARPLTVANCASVHLTCHQLMNGLPRTANACETSLTATHFDGLGGIMDGQKTDLVVMQGNLNACRYIDDLLRLHVIHCTISP